MDRGGLWRAAFGGNLRLRDRNGEGAHLDWAGLTEAFRATDGPLGEAFDATWNPALRVEQPRERVGAFLFRHACYHLGQLGLARKLYGLPGAI